MIRGTYGLVGAALAVASMALAGCADDYAGLLILQNQVPDEKCETKPNIGDPYTPHGTAAVAGGGGYFLTPLIQSTLVNREGTTNGDIVELHTAITIIEPVDSADSRAVVEALKELQGRTRYISGSVSPKGLTSMGFEVIDGEQAGALSAAMMPNQRVEVLVRVTVHGDTQGTDVASNDFLYPITLDNTPGLGAVNLGMCSSLAVGTKGQVADCFGTGQDGGFVECCTDAGGNPVCPAVGTGGAAP